MSNLSLQLPVSLTALQEGNSNLASCWSVKLFNFLLVILLLKSVYHFDEWLVDFQVTGNIRLFIRKVMYGGWQGIRKRCVRWLAWQFTNTQICFQFLHRKGRWWAWPCPQFRQQMVNLTTRQFWNKNDISLCRHHVHRDTFKDTDTVNSFKIRWQAKE